MAGWLRSLHADGDELGRHQTAQLKGTLASVQP
jgi:hypothetical protein